jgi:hypothetical protein
MVNRVVVVVFGLVFGLALLIQPMTASPLSLLWGR